MDNEDTYPKNPTNRDIFRELRTVNTTLNRHETDIQELKTWKTGVQAVDQYVARMKAPAESKTGGNPPDLTKIIIIALGLVGSALAIIMTFAGK